MIADGQRVTGEAEQIARAECPRAEEIGGKREPVPVANGQLHGGLESRSRRRRNAGKWRHVRARRGVVRDIDRVGVPNESARLLGQ
jgi:hypothetical protein